MDLHDHAIDLAKELAGNWRKFQSYAPRWIRLFEIADPEHWAAVYVGSRDESALEESNRAQIQSALKPFTASDPPTAYTECTENHWAVGYLHVIYLRVYDSAGELTPAFLAYAELHLAMKEYPVLNESDWSEREWKRAADYWQRCSVSERVRWCQQYHVSIFAARRDDIPSDPAGELVTALAE